MKLLIDMNLPPRWAEFFASQGFEAAHWSQVGDERASDHILLDWARQRGFVVFTHDLDFSRLLALTHSTGPSVIQVRTEDVLPESIGSIVVAALRQHHDVLLAGALAVIDLGTTRVRVLPLR